MANLTINGRTVTVDDSFLSLPREEQEAAVEHIASSLPAEKKEASGAVAGLVKGTAELFNGPAETAKQLAGVGSGRQDDPNYVGTDFLGGSANPLKWNYGQIPQIIAENAPGLTAGAALAAAGAKGAKKAGAGKKAQLAAALATAALYGFGSSAGDTVKEAAVARTGDKNAEPNASDRTRGVATAAVSEAINALTPARFVPGLKQLNKVGAQGVGEAVKTGLKTAGVGAGAGLASDVVTQAGTTVGTDEGLRIDPNRAGNAAVAGGLTAGSMALPKVAGDAVHARNMAEHGGVNQAATENYATRLAAHGEGVGGLGNAKRDAKAQQLVKQDLTNELGDAFRAVRQQTKLSPDADNALTRAVKDEAITTKDLELIDRETAGLPDGANAAYLARTLRMAQLAQSKGTFRDDKGWAGGMSGMIEGNLGYMLNPLRAVAGAGASMMGQQLLGMGNPKVVATVAGTYLGSRMVDGMTGMRSPARTYAENFANHAAQLRLPKATPSQPAPPQPTSMPWGPRPPMSGPTGPAVAPQAPQMGPQGPWGPRPGLGMNPTGPVAGPRQGPPAPPPQAPAPQPTINPMALAMLKQKLKAGLPPVPEPEAPKAPWQTPRVREEWKAPKVANPAMPALESLVKPVPNEVDKGTLAKTKTLMGALAQVQKLKAKTLALDEPAASNLGAAAAPSGPQSMADILRNVTADVTARKKIKKAKGKVEVEAEEPTRSGYEPLDDDLLYPADISPQAYALREAGAYGSKSPKYIARAEQTARNHYKAQNDLIAEFPQFELAFKSLVRQLLKTGADKAKQKEAIDHYAGLLSPEAEKATKEKFTK